MIPFSEDELDYIARLDAEADMDLLRRELPSLREESLRTLQVATILLQRCAAAGARSVTDTLPTPLTSLPRNNRSHDIQAVNLTDPLLSCNAL
jgi:hypothetical protein